VKEMGQLGDVFTILSQGGFLGMTHLRDEPELFGAGQGVIYLQGALERQQRVINAMNAQDRGIREQTRWLLWVFPGKREEGRASPGERPGEPVAHPPLI
jgi:hypothetical protein